jgi:hypothetical protein
MTPVIHSSHLRKGCQMVYFQTRNHNLGIFWRAFELKMLVYFMVIRNIIGPYRLFYDYLVYFVDIRYIFPLLVSKIWQPWSQKLIHLPRKCFFFFAANFLRTLWFPRNSRSEINGFIFQHQTQFFLYWRSAAAACVCLLPLFSFLKNFFFRRKFISVETKISRSNGTASFFLLKDTNSECLV